MCVGYFHVKHNANNSSSETSSEQSDSLGKDQPDSIIRRPSYKQQRSPKHRRIFAQFSVSFFEVGGDETDGSSENSRSSWQYFMLLLWACAVMKLLQNLWLILLLPIVFITWLVYFLMTYFEVCERLWNKWMESETKQQIAQWFDSRQDVLLPAPLLGTLQLIRAADKGVTVVVIVCTVNKKCWCRFIFGTSVSSVPRTKITKSLKFISHSNTFATEISCCCCRCEIIYVCTLHSRGNTRREQMLWELCEQWNAGLCIEVAQKVSVRSEDSPVQGLLVMYPVACIQNTLPLKDYY